ncbi:MAG: hypothetical protein KGH62_02260, partial [Candidatus Micrarchaeota archaeon]|nr:hypothetical protein [Candidatus Micrarchaeota archaeon]
MKLPILFLIAGLLILSANTNADSISSWTANTAYSSNVVFPSCATSNNFIYCVGGLTQGLAAIKSVYSTPITNNNIGAWTSNTPYPDNVAEQSCVPHNGFIYCMSGLTVLASNSVYSASIFAPGILSESNTVIDNGQYARLTANPSGGTPPYTINYFSQAACAGASIGSGASLLVSPTITTTYSYNSVDSSSTKNVACSSSNTVIVNGALAPTLTGTNTPNVDAYQYITFNAAVGPPTNALATDGYAGSAFTGGSSDSVTLTTSNSPDVIVVFTGLEVPSSNGASLTVSSISDTAGLTWHKRSSNTFQGTSYPASNEDIEGWYAISNSKLTSDQITVTLSGSAVDDWAIMAFGVSGVNTNSPWDLNAGLPTTSTKTGTVSISTNNANDMLLGLVGTTDGNGCGSNPWSASGSNTLIGTVGTNGGNYWWSSGAAYQIVNSIQQSASIGMTAGCGVSDESLMIGDAFQQDVPAGIPPYTYNFLIYNSITNIQIANNLIVGNPRSSNAFIWQVPAAEAGNTIYANVIITDASGAVANSIHTTVQTINPAMYTPTISPPTSQTYGIGSTVTFASYESGGTSPYTYNFLVYNSVTNIQVANLLTSSNSFAYVLPASQSGNTLVANVVVKDSVS